MADAWPQLVDEEILAVRPERNPVDATRPYAWLSEDECQPDRSLEPVSTIFLTNSECPFRCLMCDLWKNTLPQKTPLGAIPEQIRFALRELPPAQHVKLYNSGNFFDRRAIPVQDHPAIVELIRDFRTVIVENHPRLCGENCLAFRDQLHGTLEIALGLETIHADVLPRLNKQMTVRDYENAARFLTTNGIRVRSFVLLRPPFLSESEGLEWALRSVEFAFDCGSECCAVIPTRYGNGSMESLAREGYFSPPTLKSLEVVLEEGIRLRRGRVFADLWDCEKFSQCSRCFPRRRRRLERMNLEQQLQPAVACEHCNTK